MARARRVVKRLQAVAVDLEAAMTRAMTGLHQKEVALEANEKGKVAGMQPSFLFHSMPTTHGMCLL